MQRLKINNTKKMITVHVLYGYENWSFTLREEQIEGLRKGSQERDEVTFFRAILNRKYIRQMFSNTDVNIGFI
jgi:hypothetical protein